MRPCQVCGCASWGPIGNLAELERVHDAPDMVRCDNCNAVARLELVQDSAPIAPPDAEFSGMGGFMKVAMPALGALLPAMPAPPSRTERLAIAVLRSDLDVLDVDTPQGIVALARALEAALDAVPTPVAVKDSGKDWLVLSFPAREEFERWVTGFLDAVVNPDAVAGVDYTEHVYERAVVYATKQF